MKGGEGRRIFLMLMNNETLRKALSDPEFVDMLLNLEKGEEVKKALLEKEIVLREEDLSEFSRILADALEKRISEEKLSHISGGRKDYQSDISNLNMKLDNLDNWINKIFK